MITHKESKQILTQFEKDLADWKLEQSRNVESDAKEPEFCACGSQIFTDQESMELNVLYCDRRNVYVKSLQPRQYSVDGQAVVYEPKEPVFCAKGACPIPQQEKQKALIERVKTQYSGMLFENFVREKQPQAYDACQTFTAKDKLILAGATGLGKTHLARATYIKLLSDNVTCQWFTAPKLAALFLRIQSFSDDYKDKQNARDEYVKACKSAVVFIDDLATERFPKDRNGHESGEFFKEQFKIFLEEITGGLLITINLKEKAIKDRYGDKIASRLFHHCKAIAMVGDDFRQGTLEKVKSGASK